MNITTVCQLTKQKKDLPCYAMGCSLFGDCAAEYEQQVSANIKQTNADKIRAMDDAELADFLYSAMHNTAECFAEGMFPYHPCPKEQDCKVCAINWLKQESEVGR